MDGSLKNPGYRERLLDREVDELARLFGAVKIEGPKYCGKTWCAQAHANSEIRLDREEERNLVRMDHRIALEGAKPRLIDEWQEVPGLHDDVRRAVDDSGARGLYLLTGSSLPPQEGYSHSGAGRIARVHMRTESLLEQGLSDGSISIGALFDGSDAFGRAPDVTVADIASWVCRGGWPAIQGMSDRACARLNGQYLGAVFDEDALRKGLSPAMARNALAALARNVATAATYKTLRTDMARGEKGSVSDDEVVKYLDLFRGMYLIEEVPGWDVGIRSKKHLRTKPKRYFADPALAARMLGVSASALLADTQLLGLLFENLCLRDLLVYLSASDGLQDARVCYYGDDTGLEVDFVVSLSDGRWGAVEVKLAEDKVPDGVASLVRLRDLAAKNAAQRMPAPSFLVVLVGRASYAHSTPEGVKVVPVNMLGVS
ncbi:MAG: ATP-binding protein [Eggerthellaceae bacterium]|nr:ATP-binding protein [Eggerthellaceae bacterium]